MGSPLVQKEMVTSSTWWLGYVNANVWAPQPRTTSIRDEVESQDSAWREQGSASTCLKDGRSHPLPFLLQLLPSSLPLMWGWKGWGGLLPVSSDSLSHSSFSPQLPESLLPPS